MVQAARLAAEAGGPPAPRHAYLIKDPFTAGNSGPVSPGIGVPTLQFSVPTHAALDPMGPYVFLPMAGDGALTVVDLGATGATPKRVPWAGRVGPTWATVSAIPH